MFLKTNDQYMQSERDLDEEYSPMMNKFSLNKSTMPKSADDIYQLASNFVVHCKREPNPDHLNSKSNSGDSPMPMEESKFGGIMETNNEPNSELSDHSFSSAVSRAD